jgi:DNA-directed RNA polymerase subunit K/omega
MLTTIYEVIDYTGNRYLIAKAAMKRARQINFIGDEGLQKFNGKIVTLALKQVMDEEIKFMLSREEKPVEKEA